MKVLAIDPGNIESGWCIVDLDTYKPLAFGKNNNEDLRNILANSSYDYAVIEMVANYGMVAGASLFETCIAIGRFQEIIESQNRLFEMVKRKTYITDLTGSSKAKDKNIIQYLIDRFAPNTSNRGKGTKKSKGWFYGFAADVWQSYAIAVWFCDKENKVVY